MKVTLISTTPDPVETLIFAKSTRLQMSPNLFAQIKLMSWDEKLAELRYIANTIPSSWEFCSFLFLVEGVSRAYTHQQVRTRTASYAQQTMRLLDKSSYEYVFTGKNLEDRDAVNLIEFHRGVTQQIYSQLIELGQPVEDARGILPTNIATNILIGFNLRTFADLVKSRSGGRTQQEYVDVVNAMADAALDVHPWLDMFLFGKHGRAHFDEIEAFARREFADDVGKRNELLKIVDKLRKG